MNKFQKAGLAVIAASGIAFAAGSLWGPSTDEFPSLQVRNPDVLACWEVNPPNPDDYQSPCYDKAGGWWFGYTNNKSTNEDVKVYRNGSFVTFGEGVDLSDKSTGDSYIGDAIEAIITITDPNDDYPGGGIGFNHKQFVEGKNAIDDPAKRWNNSPDKFINLSARDGYCITYSLEGDAMQFVPGWDESPGDDPAYAVWVAPIQPVLIKTVLNIPFASPPFTQPWKPTGAYPLNKAKEQAVSVKIRYNGAGEGTLKIYQLGWLGECDLTEPSPVAKPDISRGIAMSLAGRSLSFSGFNKTVEVQIINLHGAIVVGQTLESSGKMNLGNLPTGIYMVRVPALGYVNKVMLK
jgi:hypothetical protein